MIRICQISGMCCVSRSLIFCFHAVCTVSASFKHFASVNRCFLFQRTMPGHVGGRRFACMACDSNAHWCSLAGEAVSKRIILWKLANFGGAPVSESLRGGPVCWNCRKSSLAFLKVRRAHPFMIFSFLFCVLCFTFFVVLFIFTASRAMLNIVFRSTHAHSNAFSWSFVLLC